MVRYMNYGSMNGNTPPLVEVNDIHRTQVYQATHDEEGNRLPHMRRSFISFTYGGKSIEDFGLIATFSDRLNKAIYGNFEDKTTTYAMLDGQYFWGTHMVDNNLTFVLSTDYMTQNQLDDFKHWFKPGIERELILSEHPNRSIRARISTPPTISVIPFEENVEIKIGSDFMNTKTTVYKGEINLAFIMDEPFWKGILNYIPSENNGNIDLTSSSYLEYSSALNWFKDNVGAVDSQEALKVCLEDRIPHFAHMTNQTNLLFLGSPYHFNVSGARVGVNRPQVGYAIVGDSYVGYALTDNTDVDFTNGGSTDKKYLFYSGTAPSYPIIKFTVELQFSDYGYINRPGNDISYEQDPVSSNLRYNTLKIGDKIFKYTTPSVITAYNQVIYLIEQGESENPKIIEIKNKIKEKVNHKAVRAWALRSFGSAADTDNFSEIIENYRIRMRRFWKTNNPSATFIFDSQTGVAKGIFTYKIDKDNYAEFTENVGDMVLSDYIILNERNDFNINGTISLAQCTPIESNVPIKNFLITYHNMYL